MKDPTDKVTPDLFPPITCGRCGAKLHSYDAVSYDGPANPECMNTCHPFMPWLILCKPCHVVQKVAWGVLPSDNEA